MPETPIPRTPEEAVIAALYRSLIDGWNARDANAMARVFSANGTMIGFDGSEANGRASIGSHLAPIFASHPTPAFVTKLRELRMLAPGAWLVRAIAGMVPPGGTDIMPEVNAVQTLVAVRHGDGWLVELFQNTPAALHGQDEARESITRELRELV